MSKSDAKALYHGKIARLLTMPDDGVAPILALIDGAERSIKLKMFELECDEIVARLVAAKDRGVAVEVLLNQVRSSGLRPNDDTMCALKTAGVDAGWASRHFAITHEKSMVVDGTRALIATFNFSDKYFTRTRDYGILLEEAGLVAEIARCFEADKGSHSFDPPDDTPLAWGNRTARTAVADFIDAADEQLLIQHPKFHDLVILDRVLAARERGVTVHYLSGGKHGIEPPDLMETFAIQRILPRANVKLRKQHGLKLHAKLMIADGKRAMLGSMNIDRAAYDIRRELGIIFDDAKTVKALVARFEADWHEAKSYEAPDPMALDIDTAVDADPDDDDNGISHE